MFNEEKRRKLLGEVDIQRMADIGFVLTDSYEVFDKEVGLNLQERFICNLVVGEHFNHPMEVAEYIICDYEEIMEILKSINRKFEEYSVANNEDREDIFKYFIFNKSKEEIENHFIETENITKLKKFVNIKAK